nr:glycosyltransferase family 2 protein [Rhodohalobacter sp. 614A]
MANFLDYFYTVQHSFSIIIVTWNALHHLQKFLPSVVESKYNNFEIIIANNASEDSTVDWIKNHYPNCRIVTFEDNYGYAGGNNRAVEHAKGDILVFLNNDAKPDTDWLIYLNEAFSKESVGVVQPKILSCEKPDYFEYAGAGGGYMDWMGYPFCRGRIMDHVEKDEGQYDEPTEIFWASGAAFAIRKELFLKTGGFDEDFEFHMEEIDLCWRCLRLGQKIEYAPKSVVYHLGGGSLAHGSPRKVFYNYRNSLAMLLKNLDRFVIPKLFFRLVLDGISGLRSLLIGKPAETLAIIQAHFSFYGKIPQTLRKRNKLRQISREPIPEYLILNRLLIIEYFLKGKKTFNELDFNPDD